jgi:hypothetical protein
MALTAQYPINERLSHSATSSPRVPASDRPGGRRRSASTLEIRPKIDASPRHVFGFATQSYAPMRRARDLEQFKFILPYASEIFGVYQPLIGWRSRRKRLRFERAFARDRAKILRDVLDNISPNVELQGIARRAATNAAGSSLEIGGLEPGRLAAPPLERQSFLIDALNKRLPPRESLSPEAWSELLSQANLKSILAEEVKPTLEKVLVTPGFRTYAAEAGENPDAVAVRQVARESQVAGYLDTLAAAGQTDALESLFFGKADVWKGVLGFLKHTNPLDTLDPHNDLGRVTLSPISVVHLFRQYFFEFDTFLGPAVGHIWLSPGSSVELLEVQTRRTLTERTFETEIETILKKERETTEQEELSDSVKQDNRDNSKFGFNTNVHQGWVGGSADASTSIDLENTQQKARETAHKQMRQQTDKISSEIRKNYKSTFKTVTEVTDTSSKRYVLNNTTDQLINYEMRRKMRQVGVQVQDIGTYLCWQTFVDDPGRQLGVSELVHIAKPADLSAIPAPESVPLPEPHEMKSRFAIPFKPRTSDTNEDDMDESYYYGEEVDLDPSEGTPEKIDSTFRFTVVCDKPNYVFDDAVENAIAVDVGANDMQVVVDEVSANGKEVSFRVVLVHVNFHNQAPLMIEAKTRWRADDPLVAEISAQNEAKVDQYNAETQRAFQKAYIDAARERIELASGIEARKFEDLREEERIVVYRILIQDMLTKDLPLSDSRTRHAVAELLNSIFDVDKMLYFVAPEWWRPRLHRSGQRLGSPPSSGTGSAPKAKWMGGMAAAAAHDWIDDILAKPLYSATKLGAEHTVGWGGENRPDNYYITEDSEPAKLGSSLGWLLQLDGDNQRNAFLNAPWVKAVIPIRPGREKAAFNWLQRLNVEGSDGLDAEYAAPAAELDQIPHAGPKVTIRDAIEHLCDEVAKKHEKSTAVGAFPVNEINDDNKVSATPIDKVYEHGFYPNEGGFKLLVGEDFEVFDQWVEILPTDQIAPVEVEYDPITGRQVQIVEEP